MLRTLFLKPDQVRLLVLGHLSFLGPSTSYEISASTGLWSGHLYPALDKLEKTGLIFCVLETRGGRVTYIYRITK